MSKKLNIILILIILANVCYAVSPLQKFTDNSLLQNANISLMVKNITTGTIIYKENENKSFMPASTMKLVTTATALEMLGPDFRFETDIEVDGKISKDSILYGNLIIKGGGDPTLGSAFLGDTAFLQTWVNEIKKAGIKIIKGRIIADESIYNSEAINPKWIWEDMGNYYAPGVYGISYKDNTYRLYFRSGKVGSQPEIIGTDPVIKDLIFENHLLATTINNDSAYLYGIPHSNYRIINGAIPANRNEFIVKGDIPNPAALLLSDLEKACKNKGMKVNHQFFTESSRAVIYKHYSTPLSEIIKAINVPSNNHYAEHVFRILSAKAYGNGTFEGSVKTVKNYWKDRNLPVDQLFMVDGSGLSPMNAVSAKFYLTLLDYMYNKSQYKDIFINSLPVSGESGTLKSFLKNTKLDGKVMAKSGTIFRVKCYAGYINNRSKTFAFAVLVNNANGSSKEATKLIEQFLLDISK